MAQPAMPNCSGLWISSPLLNVPTTTSRFGCLATNLPKLLDDNRRHGITIDDSVWAKIQAL